MASELQSEKLKEIPYKELNDGNKIPMLGLGTYEQMTPYQFMLRPIKGVVSKMFHISDMSPMRKTIRWAVEAGYRHIDAADIYWTEVEVGQGIMDVLNDKLVTREDLYVIAKLPSYKHSTSQVVPALSKSLAKLGLNYVDLYLIQTPVQMGVDARLRIKHVDIVETWQGMEKAKALGLTKSIGVSNFGMDQLSRLMENSMVKPAVNQIEVNPTHIRKTLVDHCHKLGVAVIAHTPFGFMVNRVNHQMATAPPPRYDDPILTKIANKYKKTTVQVVLRYLLDRDIIPIPKATTKEHLKENIDVFDFKLTPDEIETINNFNRDFGVYMWQ